MICISISDMKQLVPVIEEGAEIIELRLDLIGLKPSELYKKIPSNVKSVATCREGRYGDKERLKLLMDSMEHGADFVDIELETGKSFATEILSGAEKSNSEVIFSHHDFKGTPSQDELIEKLNACYDRGGVLAKIATQVQSREDAIKLLSLHYLPGRKVILGMGALGRITRVAAPLLGSEFTFASPVSGGETAPGQLSVKELNSIYNILKGS